jgi:hypothetical protein
LNRSPNPRSAAWGAAQLSSWAAFFGIDPQITQIAQIEFTHLRFLVYLRSVEAPSAILKQDNEKG